jgi:hypothetical protein
MTARLRVLRRPMLHMPTREWLCARVCPLSGRARGPEAVRERARVCACVRACACICACCVVASRCVVPRGTSAELSSVHRRKAHSPRPAMRCTNRHTPQWHGSNWRAASACACARVCVFACVRLRACGCVDVRAPACWHAAAADEATFAERLSVRRPTALGSLVRRSAWQRTASVPTCTHRRNTQSCERVACKGLTCAWRQHANAPMARGERYAARVHTAQ